MTEEAKDPLKELDARLTELYGRAVGLVYDLIVTRLKAPTYRASRKALMDLLDQAKDLHRQKVELTKAKPSPPKEVTPEEEEEAPPGEGEASE